MIRPLRNAPVLREVRRVAPVRPSLASALRALLATGAPLLAAHLLREPELIWMATGGFVGALVDSGGSYRTRAINLGAVAVGGAAAGAVASLLGHSLLLAVPGMLVWGVAGGLLRAYGMVGVNTGLTSSVTFAVALAMPVSPAAALARGGWLLAGGAWAAALALAAWPLRPYLPVRDAVVRCYRALGSYAEEIAGLAEHGSGEHGALGRCFDSVRTALEDGWAALGAGWGGRPAAPPAAERLVVLLATVDQMLGGLFALSDVVERLPDGPGRAAAAGAVRELADHCAAVAEAVGTNGRGIAPPARWRPLELRGEPAGGRAGEELLLRHAEELLGTLREFADGARETVAGAPPAADGPAPPGGPEPRTWLEPVRDNLSRESVLLRHALRLGVTAALGVALSELLGLEHGHWVTLTTIFILQPTAGLTMLKGVQRVVGTVLGGMAAALLPLALPTPGAVLALVAVTAAAAVATFRMNYAIFAFFVTPTFVLLAELQSGTWDLAGARVVDTLIGGALAVAGARLLWSLPERKRFPAHVAAALRATRDYVRLTAGNGAAGAAPGEARRQMGLAIINAGESYQRLTLEEGRDPARVEAQRTVLVCLRRLASAAVAIATAPALPPREADAVRRFAAGAGAVLSALADAVAEHRTPPPVPTLIDAASTPDHLRAQLERLDRPIRVLQSAAARILPPPPSGSGGPPP